MGQAEFRIFHDHKPIHEQLIPPRSRIETQCQSRKEHNHRAIEIRTPVWGGDGVVGSVLLQGSLCLMPVGQPLWSVCRGQEGFLGFQAIMC